MTDADDVRARLRDSLSSLAARSYRSAAGPSGAEPEGIRWRIERRLALIVAVVLLAALGATWTFRESAGEPMPVVSVVDSLGTGVVVHVTGAVANPGIVTVESGARVADAIEAVGGLVEGADDSAVNLARPVRDGEQVYVPMVGEGGGAKVNVNRASQAELETLPGIGPVLADRIVGDRTTHGPYSTLEDLTRVPGIGEAVVADLAPLATV